MLKNAHYFVNCRFSSSPHRLCGSFLSIAMLFLLSGCDYLAKVDDRDITPDVPKEVQILDKKTIKKELKPSELEEILPSDFDPSTDK